MTMFISHGRWLIEIAYNDGQSYLFETSGILEHVKHNYIT